MEFEILFSIDLGIIQAPLCVKAPCYQTEIITGLEENRLNILKANPNENLLEFDENQHILSDDFVLKYAVGKLS